MTGCAQGIVSKRLDSTYQPGRRSRLWIKSPLRQTTDVIVAGWMPSSTGDRGSLGSLVLGAYNDAEQLVYVGHVGTGFTMAARRALRERLDAISRPDHPFDLPPPQARTAGARWVAAELVGAVEYREFVGALRHPSWRGLRTDIQIRHVRRPIP
ncbi:hypothetical protein [Nocardia brasiliensis]|uniref:ATP dependent DNA ligase n=1 Tax=Nocardia brasiliensis TaxID=37326 RepID=UPI00366E9161